MAEEQVAWAHPPQLEANPPETTALPKVAFVIIDISKDLPRAEASPAYNLAGPNTQQSYRNVAIVA